VETAFVVQSAGCEACAKLIREALEPLGAVGAIEIDEAADTAAVTIASTGELAEESVGTILAAASAGGGHEYRVEPGSWRTSR
jgi:copper chaperone CopZ